jgi:hypothetical protein
MGAEWNQVGESHGRGTRLVILILCVNLLQMLTIPLKALMLRPTWLATKSRKLGLRRERKNSTSQLLNGCFVRFMSKKH